MIKEAVGAVKKSFAQALGTGLDTVRASDTATLQRQAEERRVEESSKQKTSGKAHESCSEMRELDAEEQRHSHARTDAVAAGRAASARGTRPSGKYATHDHSHSAVKIGSLDRKDKPGEYEGEKLVSHGSRGQAANEKGISKERHALLQGKYDDLRRLYSKLLGEFNELQHEAADAEEQRSQLKSEKKELKRENRHLHDIHVATAEQLLGPYAEATGTELKKADTLQCILRDALDGRVFKQQVPLYQQQIVSLQNKEKSLREQVGALQQELLSNVYKAGIVSDEYFTQEFRWLATSIKTLSRNIHFPSDLHLFDIHEFKSAVLLKDVEEAAWNGRGRKKAVMESFIWSALITAVFSSPFGIFGPYGNEVNGFWTNIFGNCHARNWPTPCDVAERWRCVTVEHLVECSGKEVIMQGLTTGPDPFRDGILALRQDVSEHIFETLSKISPSTDFSQLPVIINKAYSLAIDMNTQRCRLQVVFPDIGHAYSQGQPWYLKSILEEEELEEGGVAFIVHPGLVKWGDGHGKNLNHDLVLVPCEVYIDPFILEESTEAQARKNGYDNFMGTSKTGKDHECAEVTLHDNFESMVAEMRQESEKFESMVAAMSQDVKGHASQGAQPDTYSDATPTDRSQSPNKCAESPCFL